MARSAEGECCEVTRGDVPVLRVWSATDGTYDRDTGRYEAPARAATAERRIDWWNEARQRKWKAGLVPGGLAALRYGEPNRSPNGTVRDFIGLHRIVGASFEPERMVVDLDPVPVADIERP